MCRPCGGILDVVDEDCGGNPLVENSSVVEPKCAQKHDAEEGDDCLDGGLDYMADLDDLTTEELENFLFLYFSCLD